MGLFSATPHLCGAPLLPKLRGHFAEFLDNSSPVGLRILSSPTCVGLRYGRLRISLAAFLASVKRAASLLVFGPHRLPALQGVLHYPAASSLARALPSTRSAAPPVSLLRTNDSAAVQEFPPVFHRLRRYVLALGPDLPWVDEPSPGNLRFSAAWFLTRLSLLIPAFSLVCAPRLLALTLQRAYIAPLPL